MQSASSFSSSTRPLPSSAQNTQPASHRLAGLQRKQRACRLLKSSEPPLARVSTQTLIEPLIGVRWRLLCPKPQSSA
jgi:hypothetical protein